MRRLLATLIGFALTTAITSAQCPAYYPLNAGDVMEMTNYDKKGKETGKQQTTVLAAEDDQIDLLSKSFDDKGEEVASMEFSVICDDDALRIDMGRYMSPETTSAWEDMEDVSFEIEGDMLVLPSNLSVGQELKSGALTVNILVAGTQFMSLTVNVTNRVVEAIEEVTTPLGTFTCYKITNDVATKVLFANVKSKSAEWLNGEIGLVKTESYKDNGKLTGSSLRTM